MSADETNIRIKPPRLSWQTVACDAVLSRDGVSIIAFTQALRGREEPEAT